MNGREAVGRLQKRLSGRSGLSSRLKKYKWVGLVLLVGLLLLAWPAGKENQAETAAETPQTFDLAATEARLSEALSQRLAALRRREEQARTDQSVCRAMQADHACYDTLDAEKYWRLLYTPPQAAPAAVRADCQEPCPWRRFLARGLDMLLCSSSVALALMLGRIAPQTPGFSLLTYVGSLLLMLGVEPVLLHLWGVTPGKLLLGLTVEQPDGRRPTWGQAYAYTAMAVVYGIALYIPVLRLWRLRRSYLDCRDGLEMPWEGELLCQSGGQQTGQRFRNHNAVSADRLIGQNVLGDELGGLFQHRVHHVGLVIAVQHGLGNRNQTTRQREGADNARQYGTVFDQLQSLFDSFDVKAGTSGTDLRNSQRLSLCQTLVLVYLGGDHRADAGGHLIVGHMDGSAKALSFNGQIHQADRGGRVGAVCHQLHATGLHIAVRDKVAHGAVHQLDGGEGQHGKSLLRGRRQHIRSPQIHIHLAHSCSSCSLS